MLQLTFFYGFFAIPRPGFFISELFGNNGGVTSSLIISTLVQALVLFVATNIDHLALLALWFVHGQNRPGTTARICAGQYVGFGVILAVTIVLSAISGLVIPQEYLRFLGLIPLALGVKAAIGEIRERVGSKDFEDEDEAQLKGKKVSVGAVALVTMANGGDELAAYLPVFALSTWWQIALFCAVFLVLAGVLLALARFITGRMGLAEVLERFEAIIFPSVLILLGVLILADLL
ncbi:cadmium resistance transporter [Varibaculum cambriense]|uniref:cadmium resistance transporter n=1 Tax=Varibaculum cambriense TaxID=184870 RepID=UPI002914A825|nr:cadmium resistance transporter [Varibaculum cambriense]